MLASCATTPALWMIVTAHPRAWVSVLQQTGRQAGAAPLTTSSFLSLSQLVLVFVVSLLLAIGASAWFTHRLETISDLFDLYAGYLDNLF